MPSLPQFLMFVSACVALNLTPGPDTMYVLARTMGQGRRAGLVSALGIAAGCCVHIGAAVLGLSALLMQSALAFSAVKLVGALYLIVLGVQMLRGSEEAKPTELPAEPARRIFRQGLLTNTLNPKVALFFLSFLPQFVDMSRPVKPQLALLGLTFNLTGTLWLCAVAALGAPIGEALRRHRRVRVIQERVTGAVMIGLGVKLATSER